MGKGKQYELDIVRDLHEATTEEVWVTRPDFSGNSKYAFADVAIVWPEFRYKEAKGVFLELKKRSPGDGKRASGTMSGSSDGQNGKEELEELVEKTPPWGESTVGVKFPNRELIMYDAEYLLSVLRNDEWSAIGDPQLTPSGNISVKKPTLEEWDSAQSGVADVVKILNFCKVASGYISENAEEVIQ